MRKITLGHQDLLAGLRPALRTAIEGVIGSSRRRGTGIVIASNLEDDANLLRELRQRASRDPAPGDLAVVAGAESPSCQCGKERVWYAERPEESEGASAESLSAFAEWVQAGSVQTVAEDGTTMELDILDRMHGAAIVVMATAEQQMQVRKTSSGLQFVPSVSLYPQSLQVTSLNVGSPLSVPPGTGKSIIVSVTADGQPMDSTTVRGYLSSGEYVETTTGSDGICELRIPKSHTAKVGVSVIPQHSYWSLNKKVEIAGAQAAIAEFELEALTPTWIPAFLPRMGDVDLALAGRGVRVGVIDTGVSQNHSLLRVVDGASTVIGETDNLDWDDSEGHGTLVAGLIAARGDGITTPRGLAPACELYAYRICAHGSLRAEEAALASAIRQATEDGCDIINISFGGTASMTSVQRAMRDAKARGTVCVVAAGNGFRKHLTFPACYKEALSVSAMGRLSSYPRTSEFVFSERQDIGHDPEDYVSVFTNIGDQLLLCAPGVGIVSCWLENQMKAAVGTSFAAPLATGLIAKILSNPSASAILNAPRDGSRADQITLLALNSAAGYGFQTIHEGYGLPGHQ
ncbi:S8 family serine peptidase [Paraburkholderia sp. SIMBA_053]|uniref:S8 family serine peptidase n=1 Tax=Paraburkholderia sp. SIMBA_053 TaxID=3085794 RepID=UPI00397E116E